jgi:hypothetical protein
MIESWYSQVLRCPSPATVLGRVPLHAPASCHQSVPASRMRGGALSQEKRKAGKSPEGDVSMWCRNKCPVESRGQPINAPRRRRQGTDRVQPRCSRTADRGNSWMIRGFWYVRAEKYLYCLIWVAALPFYSNEEMQNDTPEARGRFICTAKSFVPVAFAPVSFPHGFQNEL